MNIGVGCAYERYISRCT